MPRAYCGKVMTTYQWKIELYRRYYREIEGYIKPKEKESDEEITRMADDFINGEHIKWINIYEGTNLVGFLIIVKKPICHPDADYHVADSYVMPEYRHRGKMRTAFEDYMKRHPGIYCLDIVDNDEGGMAFWMKTMIEMKCKPVVLRKIVSREGISQYGFEYKAEG